MDEEIKNRLDAQDIMLEKIFKAADKTRKMFLFTLIISVLVIVLPLIGIVFLIPSLLSFYTNQFSGLL